MLNNFLTPYLQFLQGAAYNLHQTLDGLGLSSTNFIESATDGTIQSVYYPALAIIPFAAALVLLALLTLPLLLLAGYILGRKKGVAWIILVLMAPGLMSVFDLMPNLNLAPRAYHVGGTGSLGSALGFIPLSLYGVTLGWCLVVILYDTLNLNDRFRHVYDHFWFLGAVLTGIFFIADSGANKEAQELAELSSANRNASLYLLNQVRAYEAYCSEKGLTKTASCRWASRVQQQLNDYAVYHHKIYKEFGPRSSRDIYMSSSRRISDGEIFQIRSEINSYNDERCPVKSLGGGVSLLTPSSGICQRVPANYCTAFPDPPEDFIDKYISARTVALASECILPTLAAHRLQLEKIIAIAAENERAKHYRWLFFVVFSVILGGKIANSTTRVVDMDNRERKERRRVVSLLRYVFGCFTVAVSFFLALARRLIDLAAPARRP